MADSEKQLELKKRARRRLVGSAALALTAAIVLPMVMDHEPRPPTQDVQIRIPSPDVPRGAADKTPAVEPARVESKAEPKPAPAQPSSAMPAFRTEAKPASVQAQASSLAPEPMQPQVQPAARAEPASSAKTETKPTAKAETPVEPRQDVAETRAARAEAILAGKDTAPAAGEFVVQLGAFSDPGNVSKVRARIKEAGFSSYTETVKAPKGDQTRVRAGPFASREAADQAAVRLKHAGLAGVVASR